MNEYLSKWIRIIEEMKNDNTYKTSWGRAIVECAYLEEFEIKDDTVIMHQTSIVNKMIKYYWNQTFFFGLSQGKSPVILKHVKLMIEKYKNDVSTYPVPWNEAESFFIFKNKKFYDAKVSAIISNAKINVCPRFKNVSNKETLDIYEIDNQKKLLYFKLQDINVIKEYAFVLSKLFNYKWAQLLERFNTAPRISSKVSAAAQREIKRKSLKKYKDLLLDFYKNREIRDFYTDEIIDINNVHIDHVIPWSFVFSNDIWNLVITKSSVNISKSNRPPTEAALKKLRIRNSKLLNYFEELNNPIKKEIQYSLEHNVVEKLYVNMKG